MNDGKGEEGSQREDRGSCQYMLNYEVKFFFPQLYSVYRLFIYAINVLHPFDSCKKVTFKAGVIDWKLLWAKQVSGVDNSPGHHHLNITCTASPHLLSVKGAGWETCRR